MEDSEKRRERIRAMPLEVNQDILPIDAGNSPWVPLGHTHPLNESHASQSTQAHPGFDYFKDPLAAFSKRGKVNHQVQQDNHTPPSVSNCYVFKSRLQEYAQKVGLPTPIYETIKEGPSHEPTFRSTVIVNGVRYDSLLGFFNRKAAEQSAAEVALRQLSQSGEKKECISQPVHETGLCKNLLQEYAQKMNFAMPLYEHHKDDAGGRGNMFSCTVHIGGIKYIGGSAKTKKAAELKAARTALIAIQASASEEYNKLTGNSEYTVLPIKKNPVVSVQETAAVLKLKKRRFKKKLRKRKPAAGRAKHVNGEHRNGNPAEHVGGAGVENKTDNHDAAKHLNGVNDENRNGNRANHGEGEDTNTLKEKMDSQMGSKIDQSDGGALVCTPFSEVL